MRASIGAQLGLLFAASVAAGDTVNLQFTGFGQGHLVRVSVSGQVHDVFAGQNLHAFSGGTGAGAPLGGSLVTFGIDAAKPLSMAWTEHTVAPVTGLAGSPGFASLTTERAQEVYDLFSVAGGAQLGAGANADYAAAFQVALWEIANDFNAAEGRASLDVGSGIMQAQIGQGMGLNRTTLAWVNSLFDAVIASSGPQANLLGLGHPERQSQVVVIPLPSGVLLGFGGLAGLGAVALVRRRWK